MRVLASLGLAVSVATGLAACGRGNEDRALHYAMAKLGKPASALRVTTRTDLTGSENDFFLVTPDNGPSLVVVVPSVGAIFDAQTPDAFDRVTRTEHAAERLSQIGAERVAGWFGALGGGACPPPTLDLPHFAEVTQSPDGGVQLSYPAGIERKLGVERTCVIELGPDGALKSAHTVNASSPRAASRW